MAEPLPSWARPHYAKTDAEAFLFYVAFGPIAADKPLSRQKYRCHGVPEGFDLMAYSTEEHGDTIASFKEGYLWDELKKENPRLAERVDGSASCMVLRGGRADPPTLNYLRDCVGLLTFFLDNGGCAIYDPLMFRWWSPKDWRESIFASGGPAPRAHVCILLSQEADGLWIHTRGMRKFARPDLSIRGVGDKYRQAVIDLCNRFIEFQGFGGVIAEGQPIRMGSLPPGGAAHHAGDLDDPDFNNVHVEIAWPDDALR